MTPFAQSLQYSTGWHGTTILTVRKGGRVVVAGDGQVSLGQTIIKANAKKVRTLGKANVISGFAGATADSFTLFERLELKSRNVPRTAGPGLRGPRQGLAHGPLSATARSHDDRGRQKQYVLFFRSKHLAMCWSRIAM